MHVIIDDRWIHPDDVPAPCLFIPAESYKPGLYDFRVLTDVSVHITDLPWLEHALLMHLVSEIAQLAAPVTVHWIEKDQFMSQSADWMLYAGRRVCPEKRQFVWPGSWSDDLDVDYKHRVERFLNYWNERQAAAVNE